MYINYFFSVFWNSYTKLVRFLYGIKYTPIRAVDPTQDYIQKNTEKFRKIFQEESSADYNTNIEKIVYNKTDFFKTLVDPNNALEAPWKCRILIENTPRGNIYMYYDIFKQGFSYYSDQAGVPYRILNAVAMKYVVMYRCLDFFLDELTLPENNRSPLVKVFVEDDEEEKKTKRDKMNALHIDVENAPFAKFKSNRAVGSDKKKETVGGNVALMPPRSQSLPGGHWRWPTWWREWSPYKWSTPPSSAQLLSNNVTLPQESQPSGSDLNQQRCKKDKVVNKFVFLGHTKNFNPLQIPILTKSTVGGFSTKYDTMFSKVHKISYKDWRGNVTLGTSSGGNCA